MATSRDSAFAQGCLSGRLQGLNQSQRQSGFKSGITDDTAIRLKMQDPTELIGAEKPLLFGLADYYTQPDSITTTLTDVGNTGYVLTCNGGSSVRPQPILGGFANTKYSMDFTNAQSYLMPSPTPSLSGYEALTISMVVKLKNVNSKTILHIDDSTTPGGWDLNLMNGASNAPQVQSIFYGGQAGSITSGIYNTQLGSSLMFDWIILTAQVTLNRKNGPGSEQAVYINGNYQHSLQSSNFSVVTTSYTAAQNIFIGNTTNVSGVTGAGLQMAGFVLFPYWLNESQRVRLENYWRWYYGRRF